MSDNHKKQFQTQLWNITNTLCGKMNTEEFCDYGFEFFDEKQPPHPGHPTHPVRSNRAHPGTDEGVCRKP